jgi:hypothetical protein
MMSLCFSHIIQGFLQAKQFIENPEVFLTENTKFMGKG